METENITTFCPNVDYLRAEKKQALKSLEGLTLEQANEVVEFLYQMLGRARHSVNPISMQMATTSNASVPEGFPTIIIGKQI